MAKEFGIQLYSVRDFMDKDYMGTVEKIAEYGYTGVEFAGFGDFPADRIKQKLDELGLKAMSAHIGADMFEGENLEKQLKFLSEIGCKYMILPWHEINSMDDVNAIASLLNNAQAVAESYGITVGYHNHGQEFTMLDDEFAYTHLMKKTSEKIVMELDVYWAAHSDVNPFDYFKLHSDRIRMLHLKQISADKKSVDLADGIIDMAELIRIARERGVETFIVEQEEYAVSSMESARLNAEYLKNIL